MKTSLRRRYYVWMAGLVLFCFALNVGIDATHDLLPASWTREDEPGEELREVLFILTANLLALPLIVAVGWFVVERMIQPIGTITRTAERISRGSIDERIPYPASHDELHQLVHVLNLAFERYAAVIDRMQQFNGNAAHQLRSPLAALRTEGEVALQRARQAGEYREVIQTMLERVGVIARSVEQLLELAALDARPRHEPFPVVELAPLVSAVVDRFEAVREDKAITLHRDLDAGLRVRGDPVLLEQIAGNLLDNALRFTPRGGTISVRLQAEEDGSAGLWVDDSGPGIPVDCREAVFERFEQGRHPDAMHSGLGLAIVAEIARVHGGRARADESRLGGARVGVVLPAIVPATLRNRQDAAVETAHDRAQA